MREERRGPSGPLLRVGAAPRDRHADGNRVNRAGSAGGCCSQVYRQGNATPSTRRFRRWSGGASGTPDIGENSRRVPPPPIHRTSVTSTRHPVTIHQPKPTDSQQHPRPSDSRTAEITWLVSERPGYGWGGFAASAKWELSPGQLDRRTNEARSGAKGRSSDANQRERPFASRTSSGLFGPRNNVYSAIDEFSHYRDRVTAALDSDHERVYGSDLGGLAGLGRRKLEESPRFSSVFFHLDG